MSLRQDLAYSLRTLAKAPGFTAVALLALALGIGANTAIYSVIHAVLVKPLPYNQPEQLMVVARKFSGGGSAASHSQFRYLEMRRHLQSVSGVAAHSGLASAQRLTGSGEPEMINSTPASANFLPVLGVRMQLGRGFTEEEDRAGAGLTVVLSDGLWKRRFGSDPGIVGRSITLGNRPHTVVGVLPPDFRYFVKTDVWVPLQPVYSTQDRANYLLVLGRLKEGRNQAALQAELTALADRLRREYTGVVDRTETLEARTLQQQLVGDTQRPLLVLLAAVAMVLLIACANVANLMLARGAVRGRELAIRSALGAGRWRLARQLLTEAAVLGLAGGLVGMLVARWCVQGLRTALPAGMLTWGEIELSPAVLVFTLAVSVLTGLLFGLAPALQAWRQDLTESFKESGSRGGVSAKRRWARESLVVAEIGLALTLLLGAGLLIRSYWQMQQTPAGFDHQNVLTFRTALTSTRCSRG